MRATIEDLQFEQPVFPIILSGDQVPRLSITTDATLELFVIRVCNLTTHFQKHESYDYWQAKTSNIRHDIRVFIVCATDPLTADDALFWLRGVNQYVILRPSNEESKYSITSVCEVVIKGTHTWVPSKTHLVVSA